MKKTLTINLNGTVFNIDEDAYALLDEYIRNLRIYFRKETDSNEIITDIEARIAELFSERLRLGYTVVDIDEVRKVIAKIGQPQDFGEEDADDKTSRSSKTSGAVTTHVNPKKRLYRDVDNKMLGGVLSGIAAYFGWDATPVRLVAAILIIALSSIYGWGIWMYLIMWIIVPAANTAEQKLEMRGEEVTVENIGKTVAEPPTHKKNGFFNGLLDFFASIFKVGFAGCGCLLAVPLLFVGGILLFVLGVVFVSLFSALFGVGVGALSLPFAGLWGGISDFATIAHPVPAFIATCLLLAIPLISLIYVLLAAVFKWKPIPVPVRWAGVIVWIIALCVLIASGLKVNNDLDWNWEVTKFTTGDVHDPDAIVIEGDGQLADISYTLPPFDKIYMNNNLFGNLRLVQTPADSAVLLINGDSNIIDKVNWKIEDGGLSLSYKEGYILEGRNNLIIKVSAPIFHGVEISSLSTVTVENRLKTDCFWLRINDAGTFRADTLDVENIFKANVNGLGAVDVAGKTHRAEYTMNGAGKINAYDLEASEVKAQLYGLGSIRCDAVEMLDAKVDGMGKITYKREPKTRNTRLNGIGKINME